MGGETLFPIDIDLIIDKLRNKFFSIVSVKEMEDYKALIMFPTEEDMGGNLTEMGNLCEYFEEVRPWITEEACHTKRVWMECYDLPIHGWSMDNLRKIAEH